jgi:hypothetical protein
MTKHLNQETDAEADAPEEILDQVEVHMAPSGKPATVRAAG